MRLEPQVAALALQVSWPRYSLIAQLLLLDEFLGVGDPIDGFAHLLESLRFGDGAPPPLHPECERGLAALVFLWEQAIVYVTGLILGVGFGTLLSLLILLCICGITLMVMVRIVTLPLLNQTLRLNED